MFKTKQQLKAVWPAFSSDQELRGLLSSLIDSAGNVDSARLFQSLTIFGKKLFLHMSRHKIVQTNAYLF